MLLCVQLLSYHVIPGAAVLSSKLSNGQKLKTALTDAQPLSVQLDGKPVKIMVPGDSAAKVVAADIKVKNSVIHVIDKVLIPAALRRGGGKPSASG